MLHRSLPLLLFIFVTEYRELYHSFHFHSYIRKSLNHFRSCLSNDKITILRSELSQIGTMQRNNYVPRSNPRTKKGGTRFHICMLQGNASLNLIPRRMRIRLPVTSVCEQTGCAKIDAALNLTKDTSLANHLLHFFLYFFLIFHC